MANALGVDNNSIKLNIMGDLGILRNVILHAKGMLSKDKRNELNILKDMFSENKAIIISYENMHKIFVLIKQECAPNFDTLQSHTLHNRRFSLGKAVFSLRF